MPRKTADGIYRAETLACLDWAEHGFGTRASGHWPEPERLASLRQVHSAAVIEVCASGLSGEGDALITSEPGLLVGVRTADCVPVLLADERNRAVAAVHSGWKGTAAEIVRLTLERMASRFGTEARNVHAAIGPCIRSCCYEVGPEVAERFRKWLPDWEAGGKQKLDLVLANRKQLECSGVPASRIDSAAPCTFCTMQEFDSYRRDGGLAGRMTSAIGVRSL